MNIRTLETFIWIARLGSFRAAAKRLYASQPSVSLRQVLAVEAAMQSRC